MNIHFVTDEKIAETSSKGNQEKWKDGNRWYKLDQFGYEALAESAVSCFLEQSNIETDTSFHFTHYRMERMNVHGRDRTGCSSENFLRPGQAIITLSRLFRKNNIDLKAALTRLPSDVRRISYLAETTADLTGLRDFPRYLTLLFEVDALFLNDDRHLNNIAVLEEDGCFDYCPIFDNGAALLSNTQISPMDIAPKALISSVKARPFNTTFNRQILSVRKLYGPQLRIRKFSRSEIRDVLQPMLSYYAQRDCGIILDRVSDTIILRQRNQTQL